MQLSGILLATGARASLGKVAAHRLLLLVLLCGMQIGSASRYGCLLSRTTVEFCIQLKPQLPAASLSAALGVNMKCQHNHGMHPA